jgi:hypothetical protein
LPGPRPRFVGLSHLQLGRVKVSLNKAGWLDRPLLGPDRIYLSNAGQASGGFTYFEARSGDGSLIHALEVEASTEVFASRPVRVADGTLLVAVYVQNDAFRLHRLDVDGRILGSWQWDSFPELTAFDLGCKLFPGLVGELAGHPFASWLYRQGRSYQTVDPEGSFAPEWALVSLGSTLLTASSSFVQARGADGELLWQLPAMTYLGATDDLIWFYDERQRGQLELERAEGYLEYLQAEGVAQADFPESDWRASHPVEDRASVLAVGLAGGQTVAEVPVLGQLRDFVPLDREHWALVEHDGGDDVRVTVQLPGQAWQKRFPGQVGCAYLGQVGEHTWWCDPKAWHCRDGQGKSLRSGFWPPGFAALGFGPRICDRGPLWSNAALGPDRLVARHRSELIILEISDEGH